MQCIDDRTNGVILHHNADWSGQVIIIWTDARGRYECQCRGPDLIAGRFTPCAGDPEPPTNVLTRAVALAVETYLRDKAVHAAESLFIERRKL